MLLQIPLIVNVDTTAGKVTAIAMMPNGEPLKVVGDIPDRRTTRVFTEKEKEFARQQSKRAREANLNKVRARRIENDSSVRDIFNKAKGDISAKELTALANLSLHHARETLSRLHKQGFVERVGHHNMVRYRRK